MIAIVLIAINIGLLASYLTTELIYETISVNLISSFALSSNVINCITNLSIYALIVSIIWKQNLESAITILFVRSLVFVAIIFTVSLACLSFALFIPFSLFNNINLGTANWNESHLFNPYVYGFSVTYLIDACLIPTTVLVLLAVIANKIELSTYRLLIQIMKQYHGSRYVVIFTYSCCRLSCF